MTNLLDLTKEELSSKIKPSFRAKQIYQWIYQKYANSFEEMSNLPKAMRESLQNEYTLQPLSVAKEEKSLDGSIKYLFALHDGVTVESVLLPMKEEEIDEDGNRVHHAKYTVCVSSQVGCKIGCSFCLTAKGGFTRNLTPGEINGSSASHEKN